MTLRFSPWALSCAALALLFAVAVLWLHLLQRTDRQYPFQGIEMMATDAEGHYAARTREVYDGFFATGNVFYSSPKNQPYLQPPLPEMVPAFLARLLHAEPVSVFILWKAVCAVVLFWMMAGCMRALTGRPWESLIAVSALLFAGALLGAPWDIVRYIVGTNDFMEPLRYSRPINPLWTDCWFFAAVWLLALWTKRCSSSLIIAVALVTVVMVYSYVYAWTYIGASLLFLSLWHLKNRDWLRIRDLTLYALIVGLLGLPYFLHVAATTHHPLYAESAIRIGLVPLRQPVFGVWMFLFLALAAVAAWRRNICWPLMLSLALGGLLALNQQLITGQSIVPHHYYWYFLHPLASMLMLTFFFEMAGGTVLRSQRVRAAVGSVVVLCAVAFGFLHQYRAYQSSRAFFGSLQPLAPLLREVDRILRPGQVVFSPQRIVMDLVPIYSSADVYAATNANNYLAPLKRARDVYFFHLWLQGLTPEQATREFFTTRRSELSSWLYAIYYRELLGSYRSIPDDVVAENVTLYARYAALSTKQKLALYPLDFLVTTPSDRQTPQMKLLLAKGQPVFSANGYSLLKLW